MGIRRAAPGESAALTALARASKRYWSYPETWIEAWRDALTITPEDLANETVFVAGPPENPEGCCALFAVPGDPAALQLEHVWVRPDLIGTGLGRRLFEHAVAAARAAGARELRIEADPHAEGFYLRLGCVRDGEKETSVCGEPRRLPFLRYLLPS